MNFKRALVLSPHTDDGELGAGGTIAKLSEAGVDLTYFAFYASEPLKRECRDSLKVIGVEKYEFFDFERRHFPSRRQEILQILWDYDKVNDIELVLVPSTDDLHQDHQTVTREAMRAFKNSTILGYGLPWNHISFMENCFVHISEEQLERKIRALLNYKSQMGKGKPYFEESYLRALAKTKGAQIGLEYAEAFEVIKLVFMI